MATREVTKYFGGGVTKNFCMVAKTWVGRMAKTFWAVTWKNILGLGGKQFMGGGTIFWGLGDKYILGVGYKIFGSGVSK